MKQTFWSLLMLTALTMTACSSDDDNDNGGTQEPDPAEQAQLLEEMQAEALYNQLCMRDSTKGADVYVSSIGKALYTVTPTIYYTIANSIEEARDRYQTIVAVASNDSIITSPMPDDVKRGDVHVSFAASSAQGEVARITVDCPRLSNIVTSIIFLTKEAWPENDTGSPFRFLSLWQYLPNGNYYLTVRDSNGGMGLMLTFDSGWTKQVFKLPGDGELYLYKDLARLDCFIDLASCMSYYPDKFQKMMDAFAKNGDTNSKTYKILHRLWAEKAYLVKISKRRFLYSWSYKGGFVTANFAAFENRKVSLQSVNSVNPIQFMITWTSELSHNAWFYSDYKPNSSDWKAIYK